MFPPGLEPGTFRVLGERDDHYTTETLDDYDATIRRSRNTSPQFLCRQKAREKINPI